MAMQCKICNSNLKVAIEDLLFNGESVEAVAEWCKPQGLSIAAASVNSHKQNHMAPTMTDSHNASNGQAEIDRAPKESTGDSTRPLIDPTNLLADVAKEIEERDVFGAVLHERKATQLLLEKIVQKQLVIVHELQAQYITGIAGYPDAQVRGLKTLLDGINTLPTYTDKELIRKMEASSVQGVVNRIENLSIETAKKAAAKYKPWDCLLDDFEARLPVAYLDECANTLFYARSDERRPWIDAQAEYSTVTIAENMPLDYRIDLDTRHEFVRMRQRYALYDEEFINGFVKRLIVDYATPVLFKHACIEGCAPIDEFLNTRLYNDEVFLSDFQAAVDIRLEEDY